MVYNQPIGYGLITHQMAPLTVQISLFHMEEISPFVTSPLANQIILAVPWLQTHDL